MIITLPNCRGKEFSEPMDFDLKRTWLDFQINILSTDNLQCGSQIFSMLCCITGFVVPNMTKDNHAFIFKGHGVKEDEGTNVLLKHSVTSLEQSKTNTQRKIAFIPGHEFCCLSRNIF
jgi:hypothetical protein